MDATPLNRLQPGSAWLLKAGIPIRPLPQSQIRQDLWDQIVHLRSDQVAFVVAVIEDHERSAHHYWVYVLTSEGLGWVRNWRLLPLGGSQNEKNNVRPRSQETC